MGMFTRAVEFVRGRMKQALTGVFPLFFDEATFMGNNYRAFSTEGYSQNVYAFAAIREVSQAIMGIPWILFNDMTSEEIDKHPLLDLLKKPNPRMSGPHFFEWLMSYFQIGGNAYILRVGPNDRSKAPVELWPLQPNLVKMTKNGNWQIGEEPNATFVPFEDILHLKTFNPLNTQMGLSPIQVAARSITQSNESKRWNVSLLQNMARPSGALVAEGNLTKEQRTKARQEIRRKYASSESAGSPLILEGGVKWIQMALNPADMDWLEGQKLSAREIALIFGVPPELIGDSSNKTYSNYREARKAFYEDTIMPYMVWLKQEINGWLSPQFGENLRAEPNTDEVPALQEDRELLFKRANDATFLTVNEKRDMTGFEERPEGDVVLVPLTMIPLTDAVEPVPDPDELAVAVEPEEKVEAKAFNVRSKKAKDLYWKVFESRRQRFDAIARRMFRKQIELDFAAARKAIAESATPEEAGARAAAAISAGTQRWERTFVKLYMSVGRHFADQIFNQLKSSSGAPEVKAPDTIENLWIQEIQEWLRVNAPLRIIGIQDATNRSILKKIGKGIGSGLGMLDIAASIRGLTGLGSITESRAERIARTEVITASNLASQSAAKSTQLPLEKEWLSSRDSRVRGDADDRHSHRTPLDGTRVPMDQPYTEPRTGEQLMFPADSSLGASAGNVINCRCVEVYHVIGEEE